MNLNIYGQSSANNIQDLEANLKAQLDKLNQLKLATQNVSNQFSQQSLLQPQTQPQVQNNGVQQQRYCIDCGLKEDWDEFLKLNYGITEKEIFDDYKLFLQAKQEIINEQGRNKLESMKDRIKNNKNTLVKPQVGDVYVQPTTQSVQQSVQQPMQSGVQDINNSINPNNRGVVQPTDGLLPTMPKVDNKQGKNKK